MFFFLNELLLIISNYAANLLLSSSAVCTASHRLHTEDVFQLQHPSVGEIKSYSCGTLDVHVTIKMSINVTSVS